MEVKNMPRLPHEILPHKRGYGYEKLPHEEILERLDRIEETLGRIEDKLR
jgi:hypothetical protein